MDGYELTGGGRQRVETDSMPILSSPRATRRNDPARGLAVGADGFLTKKELRLRPLLSR